MKPVGSLVSLYYDSDRLVEEADVIRTPTGRSYRVVSVRVQERGKNAGRQHIKALVIEPSEVTIDDVVHPIHWYSRDKQSRPTRR